MAKGVPNKIYTGEYKQMVVETMREEKLSYKEAERRFKVSGHNCIQQWERIYLEEGYEGLYVERRGWASAASACRRDAGRSLRRRLKKISLRKTSGFVRRMHT